jgi:hypothetical protein
MGYLSGFPELGESIYQEGQACAENVAPQTKDTSEITIVVDDLTSEINYLSAKLEELSGRIAPIRIVGEEVERLGYASPGYGSELGEKLGQLLAKEKTLCALVDSLLSELAI